MPNRGMSGLEKAKYVLFGKSQNSAYVWQDREVRFDCPVSALDCRPGETLIDTMSQIEDTKGNSGEQGQLTMTNLRLMWVSDKSHRINLTLGYNCIVSINIKEASSRLKGSTQALFVLTKFHTSKFEFIFTNFVRDSPRLFTTIQTVFRAYNTSRMYRDLKLRGAVISDKELKLLPLEQIYSQVNGVWNLSSEQGNLGTFFVTNVRLVWHANLLETFNVSIPYMQIVSVGVRDSKFGQALVIETHPNSGGYMLGFKVEPQDRMDKVYTEIETLWQVYSAEPILGVQFTVEDVAKPLKDMTIHRKQDDVEIVDADASAAFAAYYAEDGRQADREVVYNPDLGLATETLPAGPLGCSNLSRVPVNQHKAIILGNFSTAALTTFQPV
ncbi:Bardet-Biedl syndrome 5 protein, variant 2 [Trebouxia sp. C0010 RCD-2024]